ncbi:MAG: MBL fold metallo-hydrolase [Oscillibacter sp.]
MKFVTLMENTTCDATLHCAHGLSLYIETPRHRLLFDMGPNAAFLDNAAALGVDLTRVDAAILSHGHYDHGGGLRAFLERNGQADVFVQQEAFGEYYAVTPGEKPRYIGLSPDLWDQESRMVPTGDCLRLDEEITLFSDVAEVFSAGAAGSKLRERVGEDYLPDRFRHEQNLLLTAEGKTVLFAGCAHRGIVNILARAEALLGRTVDVAVSGFHLFDLPENDPAADALIDQTGQALLRGDTIYYTGHCTGDYAYARLAPILGQRLRRITTGGVIEI